MNLDDKWHHPPTEVVNQSRVATWFFRIYLFEHKINRVLVMWWVDTWKSYRMECCVAEAGEFIKDAYHGGSTSDHSSLQDGITALAESDKLYGSAIDWMVIWNKSFTKFLVWNHLTDEEKVEFLLQDNE